MEAPRRYKVDLNHYDSDLFPIALYRKKRRFFGLIPTWEHIRSHKSEAEAVEHYEQIRCREKGLPKYFI